MKPSQEYLEPNDKTRHFGGLVVHRQKSPPNLAEWAVCANSYLQNAWFYKLVLCNFRTHSIAKNNISRNFSWLLIFRSCSFKNRRVVMSSGSKSRVWVGFGYKKKLGFPMGFWVFCIFPLGFG